MMRKRTRQLSSALLKCRTARPRPAIFGAVTASAAVILCVAGCGGTGVKGLATVPSFTYPAVAASIDGFDAVWGEQSGIWTDHWNDRQRQWNGPVKLSSEAGVSAPTAIAESPSGAAVIAWVNGLGIDATPHLYVRYRSAGGGWQPAFRLPGGGILRDQSVAIDAKGVACVVWATGTNSKPRILMSEHRATVDGWSRPNLIARVAAASGPEVAMSPSGATAVTWSTFLDSAGRPGSTRQRAEVQFDPSRISVSDRPQPTAAWRTVTLGLISRRSGASYSSEWPSDPMTIGITATNTVYVGWQALSPSHTSGGALAAVFDFDHRPQERNLKLPATPDAFAYPAIASDSGAVSVLDGDWIGSYGQAGRLESHGLIANQKAQPQPGLTLSMCKRLHRYLPIPGVAVAARGRAMTLWETGNGPRTSILESLATSCQ
jgi:hypothetical protein